MSEKGAGAITSALFQAIHFRFTKSQLPEQLSDIKNVKANSSQSTIRIIRVRNWFITI